MQDLHVVPLCVESFKPYGDVIQYNSKDANKANQGSASRVDFLTQLQNLRPDANANLCLFRSSPITLPLEIKLLERHQYSSQMFIPMTKSIASYIVIVALDKGNEPDLTTLRAFKGNSLQAFNYHANVWHHPMLSLDSVIDFVCLVWEKREKSTKVTDDCEEFHFERKIMITSKPTLEVFKTYPNLAANSSGGKILFATGLYLFSLKMIFSLSQRTCYLVRLQFGMSISIPSTANGWMDGNWTLI
jgi:ureidoglycolate lyase